MKLMKLGSGYDIPQLGMGTWGLEESEANISIMTAIKIGYRHFDCAPVYGNEVELGEAFAKAINEAYVSRRELFLTSKLWNDSHAVDDVEPALMKTLKDLETDYVDLYLIHWPVAFKKGTEDDFVPLSDIPLSQTWKEMERMLKLGRAKNIGVSNYSIKKLEEMKSYAEFMPAVNQIEVHPFLQQNELVEYCRENNIVVTSYAPLGSSGRPAGLKSLNEPVLLENPVIADIAAKHNCTSAQVLIAWLLERGICAIPKSASPVHMLENFQAQDIKLTKDDMNAIKKLDSGFRYIPSLLFEAPEKGYTKESIWDLG